MRSPAWCCSIRLRRNSLTGIWLAIPAREKRQDEEWKEIQASLAEAHESHVPSGIPVVLITAMGPRVFPDFISEKDKQELKTIRPVWLKFHQEWIDKIPTGRHLITENSGHGIPFEEPELVVRTIREVVGKARSNHPETSPAP